jgi:hypothetical protein
VVVAGRLLCSVAQLEAPHVTLIWWDYTSSQPITAESESEEVLFGQSQSEKAEVEPIV